MNIDLSNKVAFVTGASKGIGKAIAETLAACGANVGIMARGKEELELLEGEINQKGQGKALAIQGDVANPADLENAVRQTVETFGKLDLAVNNAGIAGEFGLLHEITPENWRNILAVNLDGIFYAMQFQIREMLKGGGGAIVNIASVEAHMVLTNNSAYTASKHGVIGLTKSAAADYANKGIRINTVSPGVIKTPLSDSNKDGTDALVKTIPIARIGEPNEIANTVAFLLSEQSSYTTGSDFVVDGAYLCHT